MLRRRTPARKSVGVIRAALFLLLIGLAACDRAQGGNEPFVESRLPPGLSTRFWPPAGWAWGLIEAPGRPAMRYGVAAPVGEARRDVIILPGHGEPAEAWFETANALIERGYAVWILEGAGEGGSGRYGRPRDIADVPDFEADIGALAALERLAIRSKEPPAVIASGSATLTALAAVQRGLQPSVLILSDPSQPNSGGGWRRPSESLAARPKAAQSWALANPDLRIGGVSSGWIKARSRLAGQTLSAASLGRVTTDVRVIAKQAKAAPCGQISRCRQTILQSQEGYPFSNDIVRNQWLDEIFASLPD